VTAAEVSKAIDGVLSELQLRIDDVLAGNAAPEMPQSLTRSAETPQISNRVPRLPERPTKKKQLKIEAAQQQRRGASEAQAVALSAIRRGPS
jgi:hypothetical protein